MTTPARVLVVEHDRAVGPALVRLLDSAGIEATLLRTASQLLAELPRGAACAILDVDLPGLDALSLQDQLSGGGVSAAIVLLSRRGCLPAGVRAMRPGAVDVLVEPCDASVLLAAVQRGRAAADELAAGRERLRELRRRHGTLTPREREILALVAEGSANKVVAHRLGLSEKTVKVHRARVMQKMQARSLPELVRIADALGRFPAPLAR